MAELNENNKVKIITFYLPQYHKTKVNDEWWGEGFTEWTNVKKTDKLFDAHYQPRVPLNNNYYNLLDDKVKMWQIQLAKNYGVFGFCYYHYWFKDGKRVLEKPAEQMLLNEKIDFPFCFCWANENWTRNWDGGNNEIILKQDYGNRNEWEMHFQYLLNFFGDKRYITIDGKPVFIIYKPNIIPNLKKMIKYWRLRMEEEGFKGIYLMFQHESNFDCSNSILKLFDCGIFFEPMYTAKYEKNMKRHKIKYLLKKTLNRLLGNGSYSIIRRLYEKINRCIKEETNQYEIMDYDEIWNLIINRKVENKEVFPGAFVDWDNTPRKKSGSIFYGATPEKFKRYLLRLKNKAKKEYKKNVIFLNAWNEWGEGAYLEPDERYGFKYLEAIKKTFND